MMAVNDSTTRSPTIMAPKLAGVSLNSNAENGIWQQIESLRHEDGLIIGTQLTGALGLATLASWAAYAYSGSVSLFTPLAATLITGGLAKFYGGADGAMKVFTDYLPKTLGLTRSLLKPEPEAGPTGIWKGDGIDVTWSQFFDPRLASEISKFLAEEGIRSAWDFGCAQDDYTKVLVQNGILCNGLDGNPDLVALSGGTAMVQELAIPFQREKRDCVISLEVGAKIPAEHADQFLKNIDSHAGDLIVISWPIKGQKGPNQFNPQNNDYVIEKLEKLGWEFDANAAQRLREYSHPVYYWFNNTTMVFRRKGD